MSQVCPKPQTVGVMAESIQEPYYFVLCSDPDLLSLAFTKLFSFLRFTVSHSLDLVQFTTLPIKLIQ